MSTDLIPIGDVERMASAIAKSKLFGLQTPEQAIALMLVAQAEGRHPAIAARDYHVIQGRPTLKADAILARFQEAGGRVEWHAYSNDRVEATFSHPQGGALRIAWTMADARAAGLGGKDVWKQYPRAMLRARLISEGVRTVYPAVICGVCTPEEVQDFDGRPAPVPERAMGPVTVVPDPAPAIEHPVGVADVRNAARAASARVGRNVVLETLSSLGYSKAEEIPPEQCAGVVSVLNGLTNEEAAYRHVHAVANAAIAKAEGAA